VHFKSDCRQEHRYAVILFFQVQAGRCRQPYAPLQPQLTERPLTQSTRPTQRPAHRAPPTRRHHRRVRPCRHPAPPWQPRPPPRPAVAEPPLRPWRAPPRPLPQGPPRLRQAERAGRRPRRLCRLHSGSTRVGTRGGCRSAPMVPRSATLLGATHGYRHLRARESFLRSVVLQERGSSKT
jgi:hypothetical protein